MKLIRTQTTLAGYTRKTWEHEGEYYVTIFNPYGLTSQDCETYCRREDDYETLAVIKNAEAHEECLRMALDNPDNPS